MSFKPRGEPSPTMRVTVAPERSGIGTISSNQSKVSTELSAAKYRIVPSPVTAIRAGSADLPGPFQRETTVKGRPSIPALMIVSSGIKSSNVAVDTKNADAVWERTLLGIITFVAIHPPNLVLPTIRDRSTARFIKNRTLRSAYMGQGPMLSINLLNYRHIIVCSASHWLAFCGRGMSRNRLP